MSDSQRAERAVVPDTAQPGGDIPPHRYTAALANRIEQDWQQRWSDLGVFRSPNPGEPGFDPARPKQYVLDMFPYPSGVGLHVGHPLGYIATDIYARYLRMTGHNVLHAMGYDAFGLPAEQYAVQTGTHPRITTERNIGTMRAQLRRLGLAHDTRRSVSTTDPGFYKWTQWIFLRIYNAWYDDGAGRARPINDLVEALERGDVATRSGRPFGELSEDERREEIDSRRLAYIAEVPVNWCPGLGTVLANEEVTAEGRSERGNYPVYKRPLKQWMLRITAYAERLLRDLEPLDWPEPIKLMQRNWIGRSEGAYIRFAVPGYPGVEIEAFTTRPDTLFGATYMVLSPEHPLVDQLTAGEWPSGAAFVAGRFPGFDSSAAPREAVAAYREYAEGRSDIQRAEVKEKTGVFTGASAVNPATGKQIPIFIADYVLMGYGTGAIMAVPAHDERDWEFARAFGLPIERVVEPEDGSRTDDCFAGHGRNVNSSNDAVSLDGLSTPEAKRRITAWLEQTGRGRGAVNYKLRDWLFSRQRYWGEPFPIVFDEHDRPHALPESMLPVELPELEDFTPEASEDPDAPPRPPLARAQDWAEVTLDLGEGPKRYRRETNTMPNWAGSCWYYLRYLDPENDDRFCDPRVERYWMRGVVDGAPESSRSDERARIGGVDLYVGGVEHAVLHLLYARFWHKVLYDLGEVSTPEPFQKLFNQGYIQAAAYTDERGVYVEASEVEERDDGFFHKGEPVRREYGKMGKSLKNAITPDEICRDYGCDTLRLYEMSMGPLEASKPWNTRDIVGSFRFLQRVWRNLIDEQSGEPRTTDDEPDRDTLRLLHKTIAGVRQDMERLSFNTAIAKLIECNNHLTQLPGAPRSVARGLVLMLSPLAPHMAEELWRRLGFAEGGRSIAHEPFPEADPALASDDRVEMPVAIMGKVRGHVMVAADADAKTIEAAAMNEPRIQELLADKTVRKVVVVPGKMVNIVAN